jgi:AraC family transcriptional regulator
MADAKLCPGEFYGAVEERWQTPLCTLSLVRHARARQVPSHRHAAMFLALLLEGGYREWAAGRCLDYGPLSAVFHPAELEHRDEILEPGTALFVVELDGALLGPRARTPAALRSVSDLSGGPVVWAMLRLLDELRLGRRDDLDCEEPVAELLDEVLGRPAAPRARPAWLDGVVERLERAACKPVSLREIARAAGVHPVHLARVFRRHTGCSMRQFLQRQRVLHAARALRGADAPNLASVAADSGFADQSHMTHVFRQVTGATPSAVRRMSRVSC